MSTIARNIIAFAAASAFMFPIWSQFPTTENCNDPDYYFLLSGPNQTTVEDKRFETDNDRGKNPKGSFCTTLERYNELY